MKRYQRTETDAVQETPSQNEIFPSTVDKHLRSDIWMSNILSVFDVEKKVGKDNMKEDRE